MTSKQIEATILGQTYRLVCPPEAENALREAVARVDAEMTKIHTGNLVRGTDRIAVMAALSLASELLELQASVRHGQVFPVTEIQRTMHQMNEQLGAVLQQYDDAGNHGASAD